jgi:hypothetical protein
MSVVLTRALKGTGVPSNVTVGTSPVMLVQPNVNRGSLIIQNQGSVTVYLGIDSTVSATGSTRGYALFAGATFTDDATAGAWWAVSGTAGQIVNLLEVS